MSGGGERLPRLCVMRCGAWQASWPLKSANRAPGMPPDIKSLHARMAGNCTELILSHHGGGSVLPSVQSLVTGRPEDRRLFPAAGPLGDLCEGRGDKRAFLKLHPENCFQSGVWQMPASLQQAQLYPGSEPRFCLLSGHLRSIIKLHSFHIANHKTATPILGWLPKHQP